MGFWCPLGGSLTGERLRARVVQVWLDCEVWPRSKQGCRKRPITEDFARSYGSKRFGRGQLGGSDCWVEAGDGADTEGGGDTSEYGDGRYDELPALTGGVAIVTSAPKPLPATPPRPERMSDSASSRRSRPRRPTATTPNRSAVRGRRRSRAGQATRDRWDDVDPGIGQQSRQSGPDQQDIIGDCDARGSPQSPQCHHRRLPRGPSACCLHPIGYVHDPCARLRARIAVVGDHQHRSGPSRSTVPAGYEQPAHSMPGARASTTAPTRRHAVATTASAVRAPAARTGEVGDRCGRRQPGQLNAEMTLRSGR